MAFVVMVPSSGAANDGFQVEQIALDRNNPIKMLNTMALVNYSEPSEMVIKAGLPVSLDAHRGSPENTIEPGRYFCGDADCPPKADGTLGQMFRLQSDRKKDVTIVASKNPKSLLLTKAQNAPRESFGFPSNLIGTHALGNSRLVPTHFDGAQYFTVRLGPFQPGRHSLTTQRLTTSNNRQESRLERRFVRHSLSSSKAGSRLKKSHFEGLSNRHSVRLNPDADEAQPLFAEFRSLGETSDAREISLGGASIDPGGNLGFDMEAGKLSVKIREDSLKLFYTIEF